MPCDSDQMCSAIIMAGGRSPAGKAATTASQAPRSTANARSPASCSSRCSVIGRPDSNMAEKYAGSSRAKPR
jgi:hypothetical protein